MPVARHEVGRADVDAVEADLRDAQTLAAGINEALEVLGGHVDVLCANAGVHSYAPAEALSAGDWQWVLDVNLTGTWATCRASPSPRDQACA